MKNLMRYILGLLFLILLICIFISNNAIFIFLLCLDVIAMLLVMLLVTPNRNRLLLKLGKLFSQGLLWLWIAYFISVQVKDEQAKTFLKFMKSCLHPSLYDGLVQLYAHLLEILLIFTAVYLLFYGIHYLMVLKRFLKYESTKNSAHEAVEKSLVEFLNKRKDPTDNIFWINGSWGSGKTYFVKNLIDQQFPIDRFYYVSCFGIKTREQAEKILMNEVENQSILGNMDKIPIIGSLVKWGFQTIGLDGIRKNSVIIFDDLERVAYSKEGQDNPSDYNDLLGFIDYLSTHRNQKMIVSFNKEDMERTYSSIIKPKFSPYINRLEILEDKIRKVIQDKGNRLNDSPKQVDTVVAIFLGLHDTTNSNNLRLLSSLMTLLDKEKDIDEAIIWKSLFEVLNFTKNFGSGKHALRFIIEYNELEDGQYYNMWDNLLTYFIEWDNHENFPIYLDGKADDISNSTRDYEFEKFLLEQRKSDEQSLGSDIILNINYGIFSACQNFVYLFHYLSPNVNLKSKSDISTNFDLLIRYIYLKYRYYSDKSNNGIYPATTSLRRLFADVFLSYPTHRPKYLQDWQLALQTYWIKLSSDESDSGPVPNLIKEMLDKLKEIYQE